MSARRTVARMAALGAVPVALSMAGAAPTAANGSMTDPVSRVSACFAEGPEHPQPAACNSAVGAHGSHSAQGAQTGGDDTTTNLAVAGAGVLVVGAGLVCFGARRRDLGRRSGD